MLCPMPVYTTLSLEPQATNAAQEGSWLANRDNLNSCPTAQDTVKRPPAQPGKSQLD